MDTEESQYQASVVRVLGIDPGLGTVGFGVLDWHLALPSGSELSEWQDIRWGVIKTDKNKTEAERLHELYNDLHALFSAVQPQVLAIEKLFFFRNITTAFPVSQARGVILLVAAQYGVSIFEYTPMQIKQTLTGYGKAEKKEVQETLVQILDLPKRPTPDDAADGVAMAYCYTMMHGRTHHALAQT